MVIQPSLEGLTLDCAAIYSVDIPLSLIVLFLVIVLYL
jgi:hypothetical protein